MAYCEADGCGAVVPDSMIMCPRHWGMLPVSLRRAIKETDRDGALYEQLIEQAVERIALVEG